MKLNVFILLFFIISLNTRSQNSVLSSGNWYKLAVLETGVYKIDAALLQKMGVNTQNINPDNIKIYGNGGGMLPQQTNAFRYNDLAENAIFVKNAGNNKFEATDYILFYGQSPHEIFFDKSSQLFSHKQNIYSDTTFYFLTVGENAGLRISGQANSAVNYPDVSVFKDYIFYEKETSNILLSGREWFGEKFDFNSNQDFNFTVNDLAPNSGLNLTTSVLGVSINPSTFNIKINAQNIGSISLNAIPSDRYAIKGDLQTKSFLTNTSITGTGSNFKITGSYDKNGNSSAYSYLNFFGINFSKTLKLNNNQTHFYCAECFNGNLNININNTDNQLHIWEVTNPVLITSQNYTVNNSITRFNVSKSDTLKQFLMFSGSDFTAPYYMGTVPNQNLHSFSIPDLLIISPDALLPEAQRLATFRNTHDGLNVQIATVNQVYNEFSSGKQDITAIRDFVRYLYKKSTNLKYLLLFGDATYDYKKQISNRFSDRTNVVPVYESRESLLPTYSYSSDDYYGFLNDNEGDWIESASGDYTLDIGIGRLPVDDLQQAKDVVSKLIYYSQDTKTLGKWREKISFVADDGDSNVHQSDAEKLANQTVANYPQYNVNKIYIDNYKKISFPDHEEVPGASDAIESAVNNGSLIVNYTGHGGEIGWAQEHILTIPQIQSWRNINNLPLFVTATCEFGRYDNPLIVSGAELILINGKGGGIGLLSTTRPVYSSTNFAINTAFYNAVFKQVNGQYPRLGDIIKTTKNNSLSGINNRNFALLGDPSQQPAYPNQHVGVIKLNNISPPTDTLRALDKVSLEGQIQDRVSLSTLNNFNGNLFITVFDKDANAITLGQDGNAPMTYKVSNRVLYSGQVSVYNGTFKYDFILPKDIDYTFGPGKINLYAQQNSMIDAGGFLLNTVGGTTKNLLSDNSPPVIKLFMDNLNFVSGGKTDINTTLIAKITDENGINTSQIGIGHQLLAYLDNNEPLVLNDYFITDTNTYKSGTLNYLFKNLSEGPHTIKLKAWDTYNNESEATINFVTVKNPNINLKNSFAFPNPFNPYISPITFHIEQDRVGEDLEIELEIFSSKGNIINSLSVILNEGESIYEGLIWNGDNFNGQKVASGLYIYRLKVLSLTTGALGSFNGKISLIQ